MDDNLLDKAISEHKAGHLAEAESFYRDYLKISPGNADALALLGVLLESLGRAGESMEFINHAIEIDPNAALFHFYLGNTLVALGRHDEAIEAFHKALSLQPDMPQAHYNLGNLFRSLDRWDKARQSYIEALQLSPHYSEARNNLALVYEHDGAFFDAERELSRVVKDAPFYMDGWLNLCRIADENGNHELSRDAGMQAAILDPQNPYAYLGLGVALNRLELHGEALAAYNKAIQLKPDWTEVWDNLGQTYQFLNRLDEAEKAFQKTIELSGQIIADEDLRRVDEHEYGNRHWHLALLELLKGDYKRGFARYRARFEDLGVRRPPFSQPVWHGEDLNGKTVLVYDEQGMGDCIMLARYLPLIKARGGKAKLLVNKALAPLFEGWVGSDEIIPRGTQPGDFDYHASIFDLPYCFGTTLETIPANIPYVPVFEPDEQTILPSDGKKRVGIVWAGAPKHKQDMRRSIPLKIFSKLFLESGIRFFNLNRDMRPGDEEIISQFSNVTDLVPRLRHFGDVARFVSQFDLVITCDTAMAHLAGAMGKQVWTLLPFSPDWRWLLNRDDSPWYPTMRLFRQRTNGDWPDVIGRIRDELRSLEK